MDSGATCTSRWKANCFRAKHVPAALCTKMQCGGRRQALDAIVHVKLIPTCSCTGKADGALCIHLSLLFSPPSHAVSRFHPGRSVSGICRPRFRAAFVPRVGGAGAPMGPVGGGGRGDPARAQPHANQKVVRETRWAFGGATENEFRLQGTMCCWFGLWDGEAGYMHTPR